MHSQTPNTNPLQNLWGVAALLLAIIVFSTVGMGLSQLVIPYPSDIIRHLMNNPTRTAMGINILRWGNLLQFLTAMAVPALLITLIAQYKISQLGGYFHLPRRNKLAGSALIAIGMLPLVALLTEVSKHFPMGDFFLIFQKLDAKRQLIFEAMLDMQTTTELIICIFILALLPAVIEEYIFRGLIFRMSSNSFKLRRTALIFQAFIFALLHFSPFEFIGIFAIGLLFGIMAFGTGTLWYSTISHFLFNASTVIAHYYTLNHFNSTGIYFDFESWLSQPTTYIVAIPIVSAGLFLTLKK